MFETGKVYIRRAIHEQFGGNWQGGIVPCPNHSMILIFTAPRGEQHGYEDGWDSDGFFHYTGEGQDGDMKFIRGNKSILNHRQEQKAVYLFESDGRGTCKFVDELELIDFYFFDTYDRNKTSRQGIKFKFNRCLLHAQSQQIIDLKLNYSIPSATERRGLVISRVGHGFYRRLLLIKWEYKCAVTGVDILPILIASHILAWRDATGFERLDPDNGILLAPHIDALFDKHFISFDDQGNILVSKRVTLEQCKIFGISNTLRLRHVNQGMKKYLKLHRQKFNENN